MSECDLSAKMQAKIIHRATLEIRALARDDVYGLNAAKRMKLIYAFSDMMHNLRTCEEDITDDYWWLRFHKMDGRVFKPVHHLPEFNIVWNWVYDYIRGERTTLEYYVKMYRL